MNKLIASASLVVVLGCASAPTPAARGVREDGTVDENAPPATPWVQRHARPAKLKFEGPAPAKAAPLHLDENMSEVRYRSGDLSLLAVVARPASTPVTSETPTEKLPAVLLLHKGFALDDDTLAASKAFVDAGFVVMMPAWRGENDNPGSFELWRGEVDDAKAAARWLAEDPFVDVDRIYAFGHSAGGGLASLLALDPDVPFRVIASSNGVYAVGTFARWAKDDPRKVPFMLGDDDERTVRVLVPNVEELQQPLLLYVGTEDTWSMLHAKMAKERAAAADKRVDVVELPGDHMGSVNAALARFLDVIVKDAFGTSTPVALRER